MFTARLEMITPGLLVLSPHHEEQVTPVATVTAQTRIPKATGLIGLFLLAHFEK